MSYKCFYLLILNKILKKYYLVTRNTQANVLVITDNENNWHYLAIKSIPGLLHGITSTNHGDHYCLNCFHSYRALNALKNHEKLCENHDYSNVKMPNDDNKNTV